MGFNSAFKGLMAYKNRIQLNSFGHDHWLDHQLNHCNRRKFPHFWVEASWNVMPHAQKPVFVFRRNGRVHLNRRGASVQLTSGSRGVRISGSNCSNAGYNMFRGSVKGTGYPLHWPVSPSVPLPYVTVCHHISTPLASFPFTSPSVRHRVPSHFNWSLRLLIQCYQELFFPFFLSNKCFDEGSWRDKNNPQAK